MATLEEQFDSRIGGFLERTGMSRTTFGLKAVGDPNLLREIGRGRSISLRVADRAIAFADHYERHGGGARSPPARADRSRARARTARTRARKAKKSRAMSENEMERRTKPRTRLLRVSEVEARTGLSRSTIYDWSADGRFPRPVRLSARAKRWVESEVEEWLDERMEKRESRDAPAMHR